MSDRIFAIISMLGVVIFMGIVTVGVMEVDFWIVTLVVLGIAIFDFWKTFRDAQVPKPEKGTPSETESVIRGHST